MSLSSLSDIREFREERIETVKTVRREQPTDVVYQKETVQPLFDCDGGCCSLCCSFPCDDESGGVCCRICFITINVDSCACVCRKPIVCKSKDWNLCCWAYYYGGEKFDCKYRVSGQKCPRFGYFPLFCRHFWPDTLYCERRPEACSPCCCSCYCQRCIGVKEVQTTAVRGGSVNHVVTSQPTRY